MAFNRKVINMTLTLNGKDEAFTTDGKNKLSASGLRMNVEVTYGNGSITPRAQIRVFGLPVEAMNKLLRIKWTQVTALRNTVQIDAGDQGSELSTVFKGGITFAYPDFSGAPDVSLVMVAQSAVLEVMTPVAAESYEGAQDVALIIGNICQRIGYTFENNGVTTKLTDVYLCNTDINKIREVASMADIDLYIENGSIAIANKGQPRTLKIPVISPTTGLIGYPSPDMYGVRFGCFYDPLVRFGGMVRIKDSLIEYCNADWQVYGINITLETEQDGGRWFMEVSAKARGENYTYVRS